MKIFRFSLKQTNVRYLAAGIRQVFLKRRTVGLVCVALLFGVATNVLGEITFKEVTLEAGFTHKGTTWGASWGDFNGDGWPDLWVGNHNSKPSLYLNQRNGTFIDIIDRVWDADPKADTHGAEWADFDNDGDQDLVELVGVKENEDGTFSLGGGKNHLFINENGKLWERAGEYGLDHEGQARSPLWFDADRDGLLDLLVVNTRGPGHPPSRVYLQAKNHQFSIANEALGFRDGPWSRSERIWGRIENMMNLTFRALPRFNSRWHLEFAQLADLSSSGYSNLALFSEPARVYKIDLTPFEDITNKIGLPDLDRVLDVAIADFNGDMTMDMYVARGVWLPSDVIRSGPAEIKGTLNWSGRHAPKTVSFKAEGDIYFQIYPTWLSLSRIYIGLGERHPTSRSFTLSPEDSDVYGVVDSKVIRSDGVLITYEPDLRTWTISNFNESDFVDFIAKSTQTISEFTAINFNVFKPEGKDSLFVQQKGGFVEKTLAGEAGEDTSCNSVAAGDFDNDMDVDLYLTCTGPIKNLPNLLLENDGKGDFRVVPKAGGATGSQLGRGDVVAVADYDRDGFLDLFITNGTDPTSPFVADGPHQLFRNQGNGNHWLEIDLEGVISNRDGIGSRVELEAGGSIQIREQTGGMHRLTQNHQRLHFGLGSHNRVDRLTVRWPSGIVSQVDNIEADQIMHITEPSQGKR
jgi:ASPIC and UnbV/FG-GAP-like repeat